MPDHTCVPRPRKNNRTCPQTPSPQSITVQFSGVADDVGGTGLGGVEGGAGRFSLRVWNGRNISMNTLGICSGLVTGFSIVPVTRYSNNWSNGMSIQLNKCPKTG